jgi:hypothetical protein
MCADLVPLYAFEVSITNVALPPVRTVNAPFGA